MICENIKFIDKLPKLKAWVWYSLLFIVASALIFLPFLIYGKTFVWEVDGFFQWYPVLVKFKSIISQIFQTGSIAFWNWDIGLGADVMGNFALVLFDPFCYIALLFPNENLDIAYSVIVILKLYAAGMSMLAFLSYHKKDKAVSVILALGYCLSSWALTAFRHEFFLSPLILLPLIIMGVDRIEDKKSPLLLIISVMFSTATSIYFSYMIAVFTIIYILVIFFTKKTGKTIGSFFITIFKYIVYAVLGGIMLPAPIVASSLLALTSTSTGTGVDIDALPDLKLLLRFVPSIISNYDVNSSYEVIGMSIMAFFMIPAMFILLKKKIPSIIMFFISVLFAFFPFMGSVLNGLSYSSGRWCFVFIFFFTYAASDAMKVGVLKSKAYLKILKITIIVMLVATMLATLILGMISAFNIMIILINFLLGGVIAYIFYSKRKNEKIKIRRINRNKKILICLVTFVNIIIVPFMSFYPSMGNTMNEFLTAGKVNEIYNSLSLKNADKVTQNDKDFYRIDTVDAPDNSGSVTREPHTPANVNLFYNLPGMSVYLSTLDRNWIEFNKKLLNAGGTYRRMCVYSNDNRARMDYLLGVKYFFARDIVEQKPQSSYAGPAFSTKYENDGTKILKSGYKPALGYVFENSIKESELMNNYLPYEREQVLMQNVAVMDEDQSKLTRVKNAIPKLGENKKVAYELRDQDENLITGNSFTIKQSETEFTLKPKEEIKNSEVYILFKNFKKQKLDLQTSWKWSRESITSEAAFIQNNYSEEMQYLENQIIFKPYEDFNVYFLKDDKKKRIVNAAGDPQGIRDNEDYMVNLGYFENFEGDVKCVFEKVGNYTYDSIEVIAVPTDDFKAQAQKLSENRLKITKIKNDYLRGKVNTQNGGMLYLSILYNKGWRIFVDGVETKDIYRVDTAFTGVEVGPGEHKIEMRYKPVGFKYTILTSLLAIIITIIFGIYSRIKNRGKNKS